MRIVGLGSPKGGVGKSTLSVSLAVIAARVHSLRVLLVDADPNRSTLDHVESAEEQLIPVHAVDGTDPAALAGLRRAGGGYDLAIVDLPGARGSALRAILTGEGQPAVDLLVVPIEPDLTSTRPTVRVVRADVEPLGLNHLFVLNKVNPQAAGRIATFHGLLSDSGFNVANTVIRSYTAYRDAVESNSTILDIGGAHSIARRAEQDCRDLTREVLARLGIETPTTTEETSA